MSHITVKTGRKSYDYLPKYRINKIISLKNLQGSDKIENFYFEEI